MSPQPETHWANSDGVAEPCSVDPDLQACVHQFLSSVKELQLASIDDKLYIHGKSSRFMFSCLSIVKNWAMVTATWKIVAICIPYNMPSVTSSTFCLCVSYYFRDNSSTKIFGRKRQICCSHVLSKIIIIISADVLGIQGNETMASFFAICYGSFPQSSTSCLNYCNAFYIGLPLKSIRKLQLAQNAHGFVQVQRECHLFCRSCTCCWFASRCWL